MIKNKNAISQSWLYVILILLCLFGAVSLMSTLEMNKLKREQIRIYNRINDLTQAMQTKDKELEAGMRNNYTGLMYKIEFLERESGVVK